MASQSLHLPRDCRLRHRDDFRATFERKCSVSDDWLIIYARGNEQSQSRLGMSVSRKVGKAVCRNRLRRLIREAFRLTRHDLPAGLDLIVIPRQRPDNPTLSQLQQSLGRLTDRLARRLLKPDAEARGIRR